ncbi:hypothetical protein CM15mP35_06930 [bacterium]|nr:MAG: hypothetical protein CM15mP35_06930 [bacterium]
MDRLKRKRDNWNDEVLTIEQEALDNEQRDKVISYLKNNCEEFFMGQISLIKIVNFLVLMILELMD